MAIANRKQRRLNIFLEGDHSRLIKPHIHHQQFDVWYQCLVTKLFSLQNYWWLDNAQVLKDNQKHRHWYRPPEQTDTKNYNQHNHSVSFNLCTSIQNLYKTKPNAYGAHNYILQKKYTHNYPIHWKTTSFTMQTELVQEARVIKQYW